MSDLRLVSFVVAALLMSNSFLLWGRWQAQPESSAAAGRVLEADGPFVGIGNRTAGRETQPRTALLGRKERPEQVFARSVGNAFPAVFNRDLNAVTIPGDL